MKKDYQTIIHESAKDLSSFIVSEGKIGLQMELNPQDLSKVISVVFDSVVVEESSDVVVCLDWHECSGLYVNGN